MEPVQKRSDSLNQDVDFKLSASENTPDKISSARTGTESLQIELGLSIDQSMEQSFNEGDSSLSELTPVIGSEFTEESEVPDTNDPNDSLGEIRDDLFGKSEVIEKEKEIMSGESQSFSEQGDSSKVEIQNRENLSNHSKKQNSKELVSKGGKREKPGELSVKKLRKDQCCQDDSLRENSKSNEVQILKEKLAVSKKDTQTMQKLLEDVRKDYEDLQKNFEKRESEARNKGFIEEMTKESNEIKKEKAEVKRKASKKECKSSDELRSLELDKPITVKAASDMTCPCFAQSFRKVVTDVTEDFKETISLIKQSSQEEKERIRKELAQLNDEYKCALERRDSEIHAFEEMIKGLQSRIRESEREVASFRDAVSSAYEEKIRLYDDICALKDKLAKVERDGETSRAALERIKHGLRKFCTAEEYEELEHQSFRFRDCGELEGSPRERSESDESGTEVHDKLAKFHPVLKKAKKQITKLKEQKQDAENRWQEKVSQATEKEKQLCKKLKKALSELKQSQSDTTELSKQLEAIKLENTRLNTGSDELEGELEDLRRGYAQELRTVNDKLKISNDKLMHSQEKYNQLQEENKILRDDYDDLKSFVDEMNAKKLKDVVIDGSDNDDLSEQLIKVRYRIIILSKYFVVTDLLKSRD